MLENIIKDAIAKEIEGNPSIKIAVEKGVSNSLKNIEKLVEEAFSKEIDNLLDSEFFTDTLIDAFESAGITEVIAKMIKNKLSVKEI